MKIMLKPFIFILLIASVFLLTSCTLFQAEEVKTEFEDVEKTVIENDTSDKDEDKEMYDEPQVDETAVKDDEDRSISEANIKKYDLTEEEVENLEENMGVSDENIDAFIDEIKAMGPGPFGFSADLKDVSGGEATGHVMSGNVIDGYTLYAYFEGLPHPEDGFFYEGWVVRQNPLSVISTGKAKRSLGDYLNTFNSKEDLTDHEQYVLTLEPDDGDPAPADHVLEGTMTMD